jgi:hypothetical protein
MLGTDFLSDPIRFGSEGAAAVVKMTESGWELSELARLFITFPVLVKIRAESRSPQLLFSSVRITQDPSESAPPLISLDDMSLSLAPTKVPSGIRQLVYPKLDGWNETDLRSLTHPQAPNATGFFLRRSDDGGIAIYAGGPKFACDLDHAEVVTVEVGYECRLVFRLLKADNAWDGCLIFEPRGEGDLSLSVAASTGLMLQRDPPDLGDVSRRSLASLQVRNGVLTDAVFFDEQLMLRREESYKDIDALDEVPASQTLLFGQGQSFSFELEIPEDSKFDPTKHRAEFRYQSTIAANSSKEAIGHADPWERFYGLRVAGLHSNRGRQEIFDVSLALVRLQQIGGTTAFNFEAGGLLDVDGKSTMSIVAPKADSINGGQRSVAIPTQVLSVRLDENLPQFEGPDLKRGAGDTYLVLRTADNRLDLINPILAGPPAGLAASKPTTGKYLIAAESDQGQSFDSWLMRLPEEVGQNLELTVKGSALSPLDRWVEPFVTISRKFELLEQPGAGITLVGRGPSESPKPFPDGTRNELSFERPDSNKQALVYSAAAIAMALYPFRKGLQEKLEEFKKEGEAFLDTMRLQVGYEFAKLTREQLEKYVKSREVDKLQFGFSSSGKTDPANAFIVQFIDANLKLLKAPSPAKPIKKLYMPFDVGLSVILVNEADDSAKKKYAHEIMHDRVSDGDPTEKRPRPGMLFDFGNKEATDPKLLGWEDWKEDGNRWSDLWKTRASEQPNLWPRLSASISGSDVKGGRLDPSDPAWIGLMIRDLPVEFVIPPEIWEVMRQKSEIAVKFFNILNNNLQLVYGWLDATGATWFITLAKPTGYDFTPEEWKDFLAFRLESLGVTGAGGKPAGAEGKLSLSLNKIKDNSSPPRPLTVSGRFGLDVTRSDPITVIELALDNPQGLNTSSVPGFDKVTITGLTTDLKFAKVTMELKASAGLAAALPVFSQAKPTPASLIINFSGTSKDEVQLSIPTDKETNLFGRYPLTIQGFYLRFGSKNELLIRGRLGLGLLGLEAVGVDIILRQTGNSWDFDVHINEIDIALTLGDDFRISGLLSWAPDEFDISELKKPGGFKKPLDGPSLPTEGAKRNFWAILALKTKSFMGDLDLLLKIGTHGERTFWIGAARSSEFIQLGKSARFEAPGIVFAHNAEFTEGGGLRKFITNPFANLVGAIRPPDGDPKDPAKDLNAKRDWLKKWGPSSDIGMVIAGSGYLHFSDVVAESPKADVKPDGTKYLTALIATDAGLFRLDAQTKFMKSKIIGFGIAIDTREKKLMAAFRAPEFAWPDEKNPKYVISPGNMSIVLRYLIDDQHSPYFGIGIGWPPLLHGSEIERDWSQSTKIYIADLFPINTFWGGYRAELDVGKNVIRIGLAIRAGWTWKSELNGADIAKASAELGITLGGVLEFEIDWSNTSFTPDLAPLPLLSHSRQAVLPYMSPSLSMIHFDALNMMYGDDAENLLQALEIMDAATMLSFPDINVVSTVYGDVWGKGSAEFLGVTLASIDIALRLRLQICGGLKRGIERIYGRGEIEVHVTILCVEYTGYAGFDIWIKRGNCTQGNLSALFSPLPFEALADLQIPVLTGTEQGVQI